MYLQHVDNKSEAKLKNMLEANFIITEMHINTTEKIQNLKTMHHILQ